MKHFPLTLALLALLASGCTPISEGIVRKVDSSAASPARMEGDEYVSEQQPAPVLDAATNLFIERYGATIKACSRKYGFDWRLVLAIMRQESGFSSDAESRKGARGLMQIMPITSLELARALSLDDLNRPRNNIHGGIFYLRRLYDLFDSPNQADRLKLALAAYNAGVGRIYDAQDVAAYMRDNPSTWEAIKDALPLLSKRYNTLHRSVWDRERPNAGWFGNSRETIAYVDSIMAYYDEYRLLLD